MSKTRTLSAACLDQGLGSGGGKPGFRFAIDDLELEARLGMHPAR